jgi:hypothetical protein
MGDAGILGVMDSSFRLRCYIFKRIKGLAATP